jgi:hypothetical protein
MRPTDRGGRLKGQADRWVRTGRAGRRRRLARIAVAAVNAVPMIVRVATVAAPIGQSPSPPGSEPASRAKLRAMVSVMTTDACSVRSRQPAMAERTVSVAASPAMWDGVLAVQVSPVGAVRRNAAPPDRPRNCVRRSSSLIRPSPVI